jgi:hypothetical protein
LYAEQADQNRDYYIEFGMSPQLIEQFTQNKKYKRNSTYDSPIDECWEFEEGSVLFISKQHYNFGNWRCFPRAFSEIL